MRFKIESLRNTDWNKTYHKVQDSLHVLNEDSIEIDISKINWIDPIPIMALILDLNIYRSNNPEASIILNLPKPISRIREIKENAFRIQAFLKNEGFLSAFEKLDISVKGKIQNLSYEELNEYLLFKNTQIVPFFAVNLNQHKVVELIDEKIRFFEGNFKNCVSPIEHEITIHKIRTCLYELVENVNEHAYKTGDEKYCGIYIRFRKGLINPTLSVIEKRKLQNAYLKEYRKCLCLRSEYAENKVGFLELYVVDVGQGFKESYRQTGKDNIISLKKAWLEVFYNGNRKKESKKKTSISGIYLLNRLLTNGYINAIDGNEFIGDSIPSTNKNSFYQLNDRNTKTKGFQISCRISTNHKVKVESSWHLLSNPEIQKVYFESLQSQINIFEKYFKSSLTKLIQDNSRQLGFYFIDNRSPEIGSFLSKKNEIYEGNQIYKEYRNDINSFLYENKIKSNYTLVLGRTYSLKTELFYSIIDLAKKNPKSTTLIFGEIKNNLIPVYESAIINAKFPLQFTQQIKTIILITQNVGVKVLSQSSTIFQYNKPKTLQYITNKSPNLDLSNSLQDYFEFLRSYESFLFWFYLTTRTNSPEYYINSEIIWYGKGIEKNITLSSYLNFARVIADNFLVNLLLLSIERIQEIKGSNSTKLMPLDELIENLLTYNSNKKDQTNEQKETQHIGSICVTKSTELNHQIDTSQKVLYFFLHPSNNNLKNIFTFLLWHKQDKLTSIEKYHKDNLRRVGASSSIAPGGWKYYELPRYDDSGNPLTVFSPNESYSYWQENRFVKLGHYNYNGNHDLFGFDIRSALDFSHLENSTLTKNVIGSICLTLGIKPSDFTEPLAKISYTEYYNENKTKDKFRSGVLVFPFHLNSNYIISFIKSLIKPNLHPKFIGLISYTKISKNTAFSISFLNKELLTNQIEKSKNKNVFVFDDAIIDGNIVRDISNLLIESGAKKIKYFSLLDRRRLNKSSSNYVDYKFVWRLDVPRIGFKNNCILCKSLKEVKSYSNSLISTICKQRITLWLNNWKAIDHNNQNLNHGIGSNPIRISKTKRKFSLREIANGKFEQRGGADNLLNLHNSLGLNIYLLELLSISKRDDFCTYLLSKENHLSIEARIEICSSILILFGNSISQFTKSELINELLKSLIHIEDVNNYSALAAIVLLNFYEEIEQNELVQLISLPAGIRRIKSINLDCIILLAILYLKSPEKFHELSGIKEVREIIKDAGTKPYKEFHFQLFNNFGNTHNTALQAIISEDYSKRNTIQRASLCLDKINSIIKDFDFYQLNTDKSAEELSILYFNIKTLYEEINIEIHNYNKRALKNSDYSQKLKNTIILKIETVFNLFKEIHSYIFMEIETEHNEFKLKDELDFIISENYTNQLSLCSKIIKPDYSSQITKWYHWDALIKKQIIYIFDNNKHASRLAKDPSNENSDSLKNMWVNIEGKENFLCICCYNHSSNNIDQIKDHYFKKIKQERIHLEELGGKIEFELEDDLLKTMLYIPYVKYK